jgi:hypothetical protein
MPAVPLDTQLVDAPVPRTLLRLALPVLASQALRLAYQWVDAMWVRGIGVQATAAVTTSVFVMWSVYSLNDVFGGGLSAYVSQLIGAGERHPFSWGWRARSSAWWRHARCSCSWTLRGRWWRRAPRTCASSCSAHRSCSPP